MNVERTLQVAVSALAAMGTFMLGVSEEHYGLASAAVVVGVAAFFLCDVLGWVRLNVWAANLGALVALAIATYQFSSLGPEMRVLALADLMGYLQFVLLFKPKNTRNYWLSAVVSFLQVSVAAALNTGLFFSVLLAVYLVTGVFFLALFYLYRESQRAVEAAATIPLDRFGLFPRRAPPAASSMFADWVRRLVFIVFGTVGLAAVLFVAVPRIGQANWVPPVIAAARTVGFTPEMNLSRSGEIVQDPELVMQVRFFDAETGEPYQIDGEPYLRGTSVPHYVNGRWTSQSSYVPSRGPLRPPPTSSLRGMVRQTTLIEPMSLSTLFAAAPVYNNVELDSVRYNPFAGRLDRTEVYRTRQFSYELLTAGFHRHRQLDLVPQWEALPEFGQLLRMPREYQNKDPMERLKTIAASVVEGIPATEPYRRAKALEAYLRDSGQFVYTLDTPEAPPGVDPIDEFVAVHRRGHCELFAGTLAMMLRSVDIPSRIVLGYRGGEYNVIGNLYLVRQLHAHSWVEAYLDSDDVPPKRLAVLDREAESGANETGGARTALPSGVWLQLDPTTSTDAMQTASADSRWGEVQQVLDYLNFLWSNYVVGMDSEKQHESVYQPMRHWLHETVHSLTQPDAWRQGLQTVLHYANPRHWLPESVPLFSWRGGLILAGLVASAWGVGFAVYRLRRRRRLKTSDPARRVRSAPPPVDFYVQLEAALKQRNLTRTPEQTPREFIVAACGELAELPATRGVSNLPRKIVEAFYRVRFGGRTLSPAERAEVEQALSQLGAALRPTPVAPA